MSTASSGSLEKAKGGGADDNDYERERVPEHALQSNWSFSTIFAGRHTAAPELVIGPQFVLGGASVSSMLIGLVIGNMAAVLSWRYVVAAVAVKTRVSTYYQVEMICGRHLLCLYNLITGLTLATIAGGMFNIAGIAIGAGFDISLDGGNENATSTTFFIPLASPSLALIIILTGAITTVIAAFGFNIVTTVSYFLTPPMFIIIGYMVFAACREIDMTFGNFFEKMGEVYNGEPRESAGVVMTFTTVILLAWFQDQFCHLGCVDLTILRFAKDENSGWTSWFGMFPGHYFLWIGAGILFFANEQRTGSDDVQPGPIAFHLASWFGLGAVLFAGWSTANPFLYASGLAFKSSFEAIGIQGLNTVVITMVTGVIATIAGLFPPVIDEFMSLIGLAGAVILPMGGIIYADTFLLERWGKQSARPSADYPFNPAAAVAWLPVAALNVALIQFNVLPFYYAPFIGFPAAGFIYQAASMYFPDRIYDNEGSLEAAMVQQTSQTI